MLSSHCYFLSAQPHNVGSACFCFLRRHGYNERVSENCGLLFKVDTHLFLQRDGEVVKQQRKKATNKRNIKPKYIIEPAAPAAPVCLSSSAPTCITNLDLCGFPQCEFSLKVFCPTAENYVRKCQRSVVLCICLNLI